MTDSIPARVTRREKPPETTPEILDIVAKDVWFADMVEEGLFVKAATWTPLRVAIELGTPDMMEGRSSFGHERLWYLRSVDNRDYDNNDPLRVVRGMELWPKFRSPPSREKARSGLEKHCQRAEGKLRPAEDYDISRVEITDPGTGRGKLRTVGSGHRIYWRPMDA